MNNQIPMTVLGIQKLQEELELLKKVKRPKIIASIIEARQHGDLKENAEYHAAREEQGFCEGRIKEIELKLSQAQVIDVTKIKNNNRVIFGSTVTVINLKTKKIVTYRIVGDDESNFKNKLISIYSPIARGLIGKTIQETTEIKTPAGQVQYQILNIKYN